MYQIIKMFVSGGHEGGRQKYDNHQFAQELSILSRRNDVSGRPMEAAARSAAVLTIRTECFFAKLLSGTLLRQSLLHAPLRTWLQVIGMTLYFLDDVFRLNLALKATEGAFY
jgi:hypothetical protein